LRWLLEWLERPWGTINGSSRTVDLGRKSVTRVARIAERRRPSLGEIGYRSRDRVAKAWSSEGDTRQKLA